MQGKDKSTVSVKKHTQYRLKALSVLRKGSTQDQIIDSVLEEYIQTGLSKDEKKKFDLLVELLEQQDKKF